MSTQTTVARPAPFVEQLGKDCVQRPELGVTKDF